MKLKLQKVEMEMLKLRSNLAEFSDDTKTLPTPPSNKGFLCIFYWDVFVFVI